MSKGKILFIATTDSDINALISLMMRELDYDLIRYDPPPTGKQLNEIEAIFKEFKPNVIIMANENFSTPLEQEFCKELRRRPFLGKIGVLLLFSPARSGEHHWKVIKLDCDADSYIRLPFTKEKLEQQLQELMINN